MSYTDFIDEQSNNVYEPPSDSSTITGYVFELFEADVSLGVDPSFAQALLTGSGFSDVDAVAEMIATASSFDDLIQITVDSSDIDDVLGTDIEYSITGNNPFSSLAYSEAIVMAGEVNSTYNNQDLKKDLVRHVAKSITGGYAVADIFTNEAELLDDVVLRDPDIATDIGNVISDIQSVGNKTSDTFNTLEAPAKRFYEVAQSLFQIIINDESGRQPQLFEDLSNNSVDVNGYPNSDGMTTVPLRFKAGDAIALRVSYDPNSSPVDGLGGNSIPNRSYKILIRLT
jgi:hypothetical protein